MSKMLIENQQPCTLLNDFSLLKKLSSNKYPIYQAIDNDTDRQIVLKLFPKKSNVASISYEKENNFFRKLTNHPNIIKLIKSAYSYKMDLESSLTSVSYLAIEYAKYGDLFDIISEAGYMPEILARTLFHQLIDGVSYMHSMNIAHLDLKPENLLIDEQFILKITDFDLSQIMSEDIYLSGRGTHGYRAPEIKEGSCSNYIAADVYSLGVILFILLAGIPPYTEIDKGLGVEYDGFYRLMRKNNQKFWEIHANHKMNTSFFSQEAITLINLMLSENPKMRPTLEEIKASPWYNGDILAKEEYELIMERYLSKINKK